MCNGGSISKGKLGLMLVIKFGRDYLVQFTLQVRKFRSRGAKYFPCDLIRLYTGQIRMQCSGLRNSCYYEKAD